MFTHAFLLQAPHVHEFQGGEGTQAVSALARQVQGYCNALMRPGVLHGSPAVAIEQAIKQRKAKQKWGTNVSPMCGWAAPSIPTTATLCDWFA
jgi:hypothetical protein